MSTVVDCCARCPNAFPHYLAAGLEVLWQRCSVCLLENISLLEVGSEVLLGLLRSKNSTIDWFLHVFGYEALTLTIVCRTRRLLTSPHLGLSMDEVLVGWCLRMHWCRSERGRARVLSVCCTLNVVHQFADFGFRKHNLLRLLTKLDSTFRRVLGTQGLILALEGTVS